MTKRTLNRRAAALFLRFSLPVLLALLLPAARAHAQNQTAPDRALGSPVGAYDLSNFETINLFDGHLNFSLPLIESKGRGNTISTLRAPLQNHRWEVTPEFISHPDGTTETRYIPSGIYNVWGLYSPGRVELRTGLEEQFFCTSRTLTRVFFTMPDGTEYVFRDTTHDGRPRQMPNWCTGDPGEPDPFSRGHVFRTFDGSAMTFVSDAEVFDTVNQPIPPNPASGAVIPATGTIYGPDGTRYRVQDGNIQWVQDRNGNRIDFTYATVTFGTMTFTTGDVAKITDTLGREVNIQYGVRHIDFQEVNEWHDTITFTGFGGQPRRMIVWFKRLQHALRPGETVKSPAQLFPTMDGLGSLHNPVVVSSVTLPDDREYRIYYNSYVEVARVDLPSGGRIEYDYGALNPPPPGAFYSIPDDSGTVNSAYIYRRLKRRRTYARGNQVESTTTYGDVGVIAPVVVDHLTPAGASISSEKHYFHTTGGPFPNTLLGPVSYPHWQDGKEHKVELRDAAGQTVRRTEHHWVQRAPVAWFDPNHQPGFFVNYEPANDPRVAHTTITLVDTNQVSKQVFGYDDFNNVTEVSEYDFGAGAPGGLLRRTQSDYLTVNPVNNVDYRAAPVHVRNLSSQQRVYDGAGNLVSRVDYEYDNYSDDGHRAPLVARPAMPGHDPGFANPAHAPRGNATRVGRVLDLASGQSLDNFTRYDVAGNITSTKDGRGHVTNYDYADAFSDGINRNTFAYKTTAASPAPDPSGLRGSSSPLVTTSVHEFHTGLEVSSTDANGKTITYEYNDPINRPTLVTRPDGGTTAYAYGDTPGNQFVRKQIKQSAAVTQTSVQFIDGLGKTIRSFTFDGVGSTPWIAVDTEYDALGRVYRVSNPYRTATDSFAEAVNPPNQWSTTTYDPFSRIASLTMPDGSQTTTAFSGNAALVTDQAGKRRQSFTDSLGRQTRVVEDPNGLAYETVYTYDALGNVRMVAQGAQRRYFMYDALSRLVRVRHPELGTHPSHNLNDPVTSNSQWSISYTYDVADNLVGRGDARGVTVEHSYDALNRLVTTDYSDATPDVTNSYDDAGVPNSRGRRTSVSSSVSVYNINGYDAMGRATGSSQVTNGQTYTMGYIYDLAGNLTSQTYPSGRTVSTGYDVAGRMSGLTGQSGGVAKTYASSFSYAPHSAIQSFQLGNGLWEHAQFNTRLQPTQIGLGTSPSGVERLKLTYGYGTTNNNGSVLTATIDVPGFSATQTFTYDPLGRLESAQEQNNANAAVNWKQTYGYDRFGNNRISDYDSANNPLPGPALNPTNNRIADGLGYTYDANGNVTASPVVNGSHTFAFDAENRQTSFNAGQTTYGYDGDGRRVRKVTASGATTTVFVYNVAGQIVAEYSTSTAGVQPGTKFFTGDNVGSPRVVTNAGGQVLARRDHLPFGEDAGARGGRTSALGYNSADNTRQRFTGYERDTETGLDYAKARYYASSLGRFASVDPVVGSIFDPQTLNKYAYVANDPVNRTDPDGLYPRSQHKYITYLLAVLAGRSDAGEIARGADAADNFVHAATGLFGLGYIINFNKHFGKPPTAAELQGLSGYKLGFKLHLVQDNSIGAPHYLGGSYSLWARIKSSFIHIWREVRGNSPDKDPDLQGGWKATWEVLSTGPYPKELVEFITSTVNREGHTIVGLQVIQPHKSGGILIRQLGSLDLTDAKLVAWDIKDGFIVNIWQQPSTNLYDDPNVQQIMRNFSLPGSDILLEAELIHCYRFGLPYPI